MRDYGNVSGLVAKTIGSGCETNSRLPSAHRFGSIGRVFKRRLMARRLGPAAELVVPRISRSTGGRNPVPWRNPGLDFACEGLAGRGDRCSP